VAAVRFNPDIPPKLEDVINKALEKDRNLRYQHASDIRADLQRLKRDTESGRAGVQSGELQATGSVPAASPSAFPHVQPPSASVAPAGTHSFKWVAIAAFAVMAVGLALAEWLYFPRRAQALTDKDTIFLSDFDNKTGDSVFDDRLQQGLNPPF